MVGGLALDAVHHTGRPTDRPIADLAAVCTRIGFQLNDAGIEIAADRLARFAGAIANLRPTTNDELRWIARVTLLVNRSQRSVLDAIFDQLFLGRFDDAARGASDAPLLPSGIEPSQRPRNTPPSANSQTSKSEPPGRTSGVPQTSPNPDDSRVTRDVNQ